MILYAFVSSNWSIKHVIYFLYFFVSELTLYPSIGTLYLLFKPEFFKPTQMQNFSTCSPLEDYCTIVAYTINQLELSAHLFKASSHVASNSD